MNGRVLRAAVGAAGAAALAGCGGGGGGGSHSTTVTVDTAGNVLSFAAFQDGTGAWKPVTAGANGKITVKVTNSAGKFGLAAVVPGSQSIWIVEATIKEATEFTIPSPDTSTTNPATISGTVANMAEGQTMMIVADDSQTLASVNGAYSFNTDQTVPWDAVAFLQSSTGPISASIRRSLAASATTQNYDASTTDFQPVVPFTLTVPPATGATQTLTYVDLVTSNGSDVQVGSTFNTSSTPLFAPAVGQRNVNDVYYYYATSSTSATPSSTTEVVKSTPASMTINGPTLPSDVTVSTQAAGANNLLQASWTPDPTAKTFYFSFDSSDGSYTYNVYVTPGWLGSAAVKSFVSPDLSTVAGWNSTLNPATSIGFWSYEAVASNLSSADLFLTPNTVADGTSFTYWDDNGTTAAAIARPAATTRHAPLLGIHNLAPRKRHR